MTVGPGDTVAKLAARHYGRVDSGILDIVRKANSNLGNIDLIYEGQKINLPAITRYSQGHVHGERGILPFHQRGHSSVSRPGQERV